MAPRIHEDPQTSFYIYNPTVEYCCCPQAHCEMSESTALLCFVLTIVFGGLGTLVASFCDRRGWNGNTFGLTILAFIINILCAVTIIVPIGYILLIYHSFKNYQIASKIERQQL